MRAVLRFRLLGFPAQISVWFCAAVCLLCWFDRTGSMRACMAAAAVHELAHLHEANHSPRFHAIVERYLPEWRERQKMLAAFKPL